jgi:hypothetical protein
MDYKTTFLFALLFFFTEVASADNLSAISVLSEVAKSGPKSVINKYYYTGDWDTIVDGIGTADDNWLKVYVELHKGSDAGYSEELDEALFDVALPNAPFKVFAIVQDIDCEFTFDASCPPGGITNYLIRLEQALNKASTPEQHRMKKECLAGIKKTRAAFPNPKAYCTKQR